MTTRGDPSCDDADDSIATEGGSMKRLVIILILAALGLGVLATGAAAGPGRTCAPTPGTIATFSPGEWGAFAEGMAANSHGTLFVSLTTWGYYDDTTAESNFGEVWKVVPGRDPVRLANMDLSPYGMLLGVAVDRCDRVYVAAYDMESGLTPNGVYRLEGDGSLTQVVALPEGAWPNGMAFHDNRLYITDTALGAVWRVRLGCGSVSPTEPWLQDDLLAPGDPSQDETASGLGANGLAFRGDDLFVGVYDAGRIVRVHVRDNGSHAKPAVVCERPELKTADGMAFDLAGGLWITTNMGTTGVSPSGALYTLAPGGRLMAVADDPGWLNYPTTPVFGATRGTSCTLFVENGAYFNWEDGSSPDIRTLRVGIPGLPLW
jgi:sugar lactone lactonase YvrE